MCGSLADCQIIAGGYDRQYAAIELFGHLSAYEERLARG